MAELPENLQIIKTEGSQLPETEAQPRRLIKERLNWHVKRRLQREQEPQNTLPHKKIKIITHPSLSTEQETVAIVAPVPVQAPQQSPQSANVNVNSTANDSDVTTPTSTLKRKEKQQQKEPAKTRRPYQKRTDKNTTKIQSQTQPQIRSDDGGRARKNKRHKQQQQHGSVAGNTVTLAVGNAGPSGSSGILCLSPSVEEGSGGGGDETDGRDIYSRDKDKCPDILSLVLSGKKRALLQNAEVQDILGKIMAAFKN
ncbi:uncharacterized protein LOC101452159 [Ceratitis capitata]|uniref:Uncharacterized protein n=1 Tax=Ceratitis capitata TaxID=7213 RepID=W8C7T7_CERCA|nr:uncharacterized protein LOC101452159 [Ceratitis capitata]